PTSGSSSSCRSTKSSSSTMYPSKPDPYYPPPPQSTGSYYPAAPPTTGVPVPLAPGVFHIQAPVTGPWSTGLCHCCDDVGNCCITCFCPCITFGQIAEIIDKGSASCGVSGALYALLAFVTFCPCFYSCFYRSKLRRQYGLKEEPCADCLVHCCCCESCSLCQMYRELKRRGFDMSIGSRATPSLSLSLSL
ncbi:unnamed protein product, partial [Musa hybrid cultivar]